MNVSVTIGNEGAASRQAQHGGDRATLRSEAFRHEPVQRPAAGPRGWAACTCGEPAVARFLGWEVSVGCGSQAQAAQALARMSRGGYERDYGEGGRAYL